MEFSDAIKDPRHERHGEFVEWRGEFDPEAFDLEAVNENCGECGREELFRGRRTVIENESRWTEVEGGRVHYLIEEDERGPSPTRFRPEIASR